MIRISGQGYSSVRVIADEGRGDKLEGDRPDV